MAVKVSVVVAVYNSGDNIERLIASLENQSMPTDELELVFVDDGSTDGTPERLSALAARRANVTVTQIPNSGWPGRPRNIGCDLARGEYVFFADHDDEFFPEALERMHDLATANGSDIVYGKLVTEGMPTPFWSLARRTIGQADLVRDDLLINRMVHKLYRRQFLRDHSIRFAEGVVRLEDHMFMAQAMPLAKAISVLADYPCYRWVVRNDGTNNSTDQVSFPGYWGYLATSMDLFSERAGPGQVNDAALAWAGQRMLLHARPAQYLPADDEARAAMLSPLYDLVSTRLPERIDARVPVLKRLRLRALRSRDRESFDRIQELTNTLTFPVTVEGVDWADGALRLVASSRLSVSEDTAFAVQQDGTDLLLPVDQVGPDVPPGSRTLLMGDAGTLELTVRHRNTSVEWPLHGTQHTVMAPIGSGVGLAVTWEGVVDVRHGAFGSMLEDGIWDVLARVQFLGESRVLRVPVPQGLLMPDRTTKMPERDALAYRTATSTLAVKITSAGAEAARPRVVRASWRHDALHLWFDPPVSEPAVVMARMRGQHDGWETPVVDGTAALRFTPSRPGQVIDLSLRTGPAEASGEQRLAYGLTDVVKQRPYVVYETAHGSVSVRHVPSLLVRALSRLRNVGR